MTTMELNLRKAMKEKDYPWAPTEDQFRKAISKAETDFEKGDYCTQEVLTNRLKNKLASW